MSRPRSGLPNSVTGTPERRRRLEILAWLLACATVVASAAWGPAMAAAARVLRPSQLDTAGYHGQATEVVEAARLQMWGIALTSFLVIVGLAWTALVLGCKALRMMASTPPLARVQQWAVWTLLGALMIGLGLFPLSSLARLFHLPSSAVGALAPISLACAVGSFMLSGIVVRLAPARADQVQTPGQPRRREALICLLAASLVIVVWFFVYSAVAQFIIGFYLHFVF